MPNNRYRQYKWHKRVGDYPFTHAVAAALFNSAILFALTLGTNPVGEHLGLALVLFAIPATVLIMIGLQWKGQVVTAYGIEQTGHWLAVGTWLINIWLVFTLAGVATIGPSVIFLAAHVLRAFRLHKEARSIRHFVREAARREVGVARD